MGKPRKQTYTMEMYLKKMKDQDIRSDQDVQRLSGAWNKNMLNELISTVLNGEYIPPVILGQESNSQMWIIDGLQRSTGLMMFRYGKYRITSSIEEPVIAYRAKARDAEGEVCIDGNGDIVWEEKTCDLRHKGYDRLPEELQKKFNEYQIETVIHENYCMKEISRLVRRYNNHKAMNVSQKAFTFVDRYARKIREILKRKFFIDCTGYTNNERKNGSLERIIMESVMCMFHLDNWKKTGQIGAYVNENASMEEFDTLDAVISRLEGIITDDLYQLFTSRDSFILFTLFHKFTDLGMDDGKFADFLSYFKAVTDGVDMNEFYDIDRNSSTKDKTVVVKKLSRLEGMLYEYLDIPMAEANMNAADNILEFIRKNVNPNTTQDDIELYKDVLKDFASKAGISSRILAEQNQASMMGIIAYSFKNDIDLDDWIMDYCGRNNDYISDQAENYLHMKNDLQQFLKLADVA